MNRPLAIDIDELVISGCDPADGDRVARALRLELQRLLERHVAAGGAVDERRLASIDAGSLEMSSGADPHEIGMEAARAVFGAVTR